MPYSAPAMPVMNAEVTKAEQLVGVQIDAHDARGRVVVADRDKGAADAAAADVEGGEQRQDREAEAEMREGGIAVEADAEDFRPLHRDTAGAVGQPTRLQDHRVDDEGEGQRGDREIETLEPQRRRADDEARHPRHDARGEKADERRLAVFRNDYCVAISPGNEKADMAKRDQPGIAGQDVETERTGCGDQDDDQEGQCVSVQRIGCDDQCKHQNHRP